MMTNFEWPDGYFNCHLCGLDKPARAFYERRWTKNQDKGCRECKRKRNNSRTGKRQAILDRVKLERGCEDDRCVGYPNDARVLQFDHRPGTVKEFSIGGSTTEGTYDAWLERALAEIAKCDVVCANCHLLRTHRDGRPTSADHDLRAAA